MNLLFFFFLSFSACLVWTLSVLHIPDSFPQHQHTRHVYRYPCIFGVATPSNTISISMNDKSNSYHKHWNNVQYYDIIDPLHSLAVWNRHTRRVLRDINKKKISKHSSNKCVLTRWLNEANGGLGFVPSFCLAICSPVQLTRVIFRISCIYIFFLCHLIIYIVWITIIGTALPWQAFSLRMRKLRVRNSIAFRCGMQHRVNHSHLNYNRGFYIRAWILGLDSIEHA